MPREKHEIKLFGFVHVIWTRSSYFRQLTQPRTTDNQPNQVILSRFNNRKLFCLVLDYKLSINTLKRRG